MRVWDEVIGQADAVRQLQSAAAGHGMTHAWLMTGPPGSGRSVAAKAFAATLQCMYAGTPQAGCGGCDSCRMVQAGTHPDVTVTATEHVMLRVDDVRPLIGTAQQRPALGRCRVMVIEDADRLNDTSGNVLLKALEEPPPHTIWMLCAPSPHDVLVTIRSRCRHLGLRMPPPEAVAQLLVDRDGVEPGLALVAARATDSHVGRARRLATDPQAWQRRLAITAIPRQLQSVGAAVLAAQRLVSAASDEARARTEQRDTAERAELLRSLGAEGLTRLPPPIRAQVRQLEENQKRRATRSGRDMIDGALLDLMSIYRDVLMVHLGVSEAVINTEAWDDICALVQVSTPERALRYIDAIAQARDRLTANVAPLVAIEALLVQLVHDTTRRDAVRS